MQPAYAFRHLLMTAGLCRYSSGGELHGQLAAPVGYLEELPTLDKTGPKALGVFTSPGITAPDLLPWDAVTVRVIVRIDGGNTYASNTAGRDWAERIRNTLHGLGSDGYGLLIGPPGQQQWLSNLLARDTAPVALGPETGSTVPRWSVAFTADVANQSAHRQEIAQ